MKNKVFDLTSRVGSEPLEMDEQTYLTCLLWTVKYMFLDFQNLMEKEGRNFGIVKSYDQSIEQAFEKIDKHFEDIEGKVLYLLKAAYRQEFRRLTEKRLSPADSSICIMRKVLSIIEEYSDFEYLKETETIMRVLEKLYNNIRTYSKKDSLFFFGDIIRRCIKEKLIGEYFTDKFTFNNTESTEKELYGETTKLCVGEEHKIFELEL
jgi:hypothetical protein